MFIVLGLLNTISTVCSCVILALFVRMIRKMVFATQVDVSSKSSNRVATGLKINTVVTSLHIILLAGLMIIIFLDEVVYEILPGSDQTNVTFTYYFLIGALDIFVSYITWFILSDDQETTVMLKDGSSNKFYLAVDVIDTVATRDADVSLNSEPYGFSS